MIFRRVLAFLVFAMLGSVLTMAAPRIQLKVPPFPGGTFQNFSSVTLPPTGYPALEIWIEDALAAIQASSIRVLLNEIPMTPFVSANPLPGGVRVIIKLGASTNPEYALKPDIENLLTFDAADTARVKYAARFYLTIDRGVTAPRLVTVKRTPMKEVAAPIVKLPPEVKFTSNWPTRTHDSTVVLAADVADSEGLVRVVIEVNGKDVEEIQMQNERPMRKRDGFIARTTLPGDVTGDSRHLELSIPIQLPKSIVVIAVRAENVLGLRTRVDRVITRE